MAAKKKLRSYDWFGKPGIDSMAHRSWMKNQGLPPDLFDGRPVIGICNTWSELTPCNAHFRQLAERVKHGVLEAGGFPLEFPVMSLGEPLMRPTAMLFRNLASMDVEESIRANPLDGVILLTGCDKTTPALMMGAASCDVPALVVSGGPMLNGRWRDQTVGSGTHIWKFKEMLKTGEMDDDDLLDAEQAMSRSAGHCMTMGTASTMASMAEALGMALPTNAAIPAVDSRRYVLAHMAGRRIVQLVKDDTLVPFLPARIGVVEVTLSDGTRLTDRVDAVRGTVRNPMTRQEVVDKARDLIAPVLGAGQAGQLIEAVLALDTMASIRALRPLLQRA